MTCTSFSASEKVEAETGGPDAGAAPKVGGAPGVAAGGAPAWLPIAAARRGSAEDGKWCGNEELPARVHRGFLDGFRPPRGCIACCGSHPVTRLARLSTGPGAGSASNLTRSRASPRTISSPD